MAHIFLGEREDSTAEIKIGAEGKGQDVQMCLCLTGQRSADTWKVLILLKSSMSAALVGVALH